MYLTRSIHPLASGEDVPIFTRQSGWSTADQDFGGRLPHLLREVVETIADSSTIRLLTEEYAPWTRPLIRRPNVFG